jgi:hypothetical protein
VVAPGAGHEKRNVNWSEARGRWDVASGLKKQAQIDELTAFFRARKAIRFKDWADYKAAGQLLGTREGATKTFQTGRRTARRVPCPARNRSSTAHRGRRCRRCEKQCCLTRRSCPRPCSPGLAECLVPVIRELVEVRHGPAISVARIEPQGVLAAR